MCNTSASFHLFDILCLQVLVNIVLLKMASKFNIKVPLNKFYPLFDRRTVELSRASATVAFAHRQSKRPL